jgi:hypothetical protein
MGILGIIPMLLGGLGLWKAQQDSEARGRVHAIIAILLGFLELIVGCGSGAYVGYLLNKR